MATQVIVPRGVSSVISQYSKLPRKFHRVYGELKTRHDIDFPAVITKSRIPQADVNREYKRPGSPHNG